MKKILSIGSASAWLLVVAAVATSVAGFLAVRWMTKSPDASPLLEKRPVVTVQVAKAAPVTLADSLALSGTVQAKDRLLVASELGGLKIEEILVEEGDQVARGQLMARLNTDISQARLAQLQARRDQQLAALEKARQPQRPLEIAQLESALNQAESMVEQERSNARLVEAALQNAEANLSRYSNLYGQGAVAQTEQENRKLEVDRQRAQLQAARDRIEGAKFAAQQARERFQLGQQGGRSEDVAIVQAQIRELDAQIEENRLLIAQGSILAPADGWVLKRQARLGDVAANGKVLFELAKNGELELLGQVPEVRLAQVRVGQLATVLHGGKTVSGRVWKLSPLVNEQNRNAEVRIALPANSGLRPGMFAEATIAVGDSTAIAVPLESVRGEDPEYYVFLLDGNKAKRQDVVVGSRREGHAMVEEGLKVGQEVITEGGGFLRDGDTVARP
jgi:multidrug efflux pump subunit AcrA (membrane-fusion protein)